jgi:hypothetical protein
MADTLAGSGSPLSLTARLRQFTPGSDIGLAFGVVVLLSVLILPLPTLLLDLGLALSITAAVLVLMVALFLNRPLDFSSFPTLLLLTIHFSPPHRRDLETPTPLFPTSDASSHRPPPCGSSLYRMYPVITTSPSTVPIIHGTSRGNGGPTPCPDC